MKLLNVTVLFTLSTYLIGAAQKSALQCSLLHWDVDRPSTGARALRCMQVSLANGSAYLLGISIV
jgi:hypothetical protein